MTAKSHDPHVTLVVKSTSGTWENARFNMNNKGQKILDDAIAYFSLDPSPAAPYILTHDGRTLALAEKIKDLGLTDGDIVIVEAGQPVDG